LYGYRCRSGGHRVGAIAAYTSDLGAEVGDDRVRVVQDWAQAMPLKLVRNAKHAVPVAVGALEQLHGAQTQQVVNGCAGGVVQALTAQGTFKLEFHEQLKAFVVDRVFVAHLHAGHILAFACRGQVFALSGSRIHIAQATEHAVVLSI
ncbi:hypothetical protein B7939_12610, partial [Eggerthia catenaformis]